MYGRDEWDKSSTPTDFMLNIVGGLEQRHFRGFMKIFLYLRVNYKSTIYNDLKIILCSRICVYI
jgi:hypothetical protein